MLSRFLMIAVSVSMLAACSTKDKDMIDDENITITEREQISQGPLGDIYGDPSVQSQPLGGGVMGGSSQQDLVVNVGDRIFYGTDSYSLSSEARTTLENQAEWLKQRPNVYFTIEGHADERGTREYNLALGERRADAVKNYLMALGVSASRINVVSFGKERPAVAGSNSSAWSQNRRAVTQLN